MNNIPKFKIKLGNLGSPPPAQPPPADPAPSIAPLPSASEASLGPAATGPAGPPAGFKLKIKVGNSSSLQPAGSLPPPHPQPSLKRPAPHAAPRVPGPKRPKVPGATRGGPRGRPPGPGRPPGLGGPTRKRKQLETEFAVPEFDLTEAGMPNFTAPTAAAVLPGAAPKLKLKVTASTVNAPPPIISHGPLPRRRGRPPKSQTNFGDRPAKAEDDVSFNVNIQPREYSLRNTASTAALNEDGSPLNMMGKPSPIPEVAQVSIIQVSRPPRKEDFEKILAKVTEKDTTSLFKNPVTDLVAPGYSQIIKEPMDISTMKTKLEAGEYTTWESFEKHLMLMFDNALEYNQQGDQIWRFANKFRTQAVKIVNTVKQGKKVAEKSGAPPANVVSRKKSQAVKAQQKAQRDQARTKARQEQRAAHEAKILKKAGVTSLQAGDDEERLKQSYSYLPADKLVMPWKALGGGSNAEGTAFATTGTLTLHSLTPLPSAAALAASISRFASNLTGKAKELLLGKAEQVSELPLGIAPGSKPQLRSRAGPILQPGTVAVLDRLEKIPEQQAVPAVFAQCAMRPPFMRMMPMPQRR